MHAIATESSEIFLGHVQHIQHFSQYSELLPKKKFSHSNFH